MLIMKKESCKTNRSYALAGATAWRAHRQICTSPTMSMRCGGYGKLETLVAETPNFQNKLWCLYDNAGYSPELGSSYAPTSCLVAPALSSH